MSDKGHDLHRVDTYQDAFLVPQRPLFSEVVLKPWKKLYSAYSRPNTGIGIKAIRVGDWELTKTEYKRITSQKTFIIYAEYETDSGEILYDVGHIRDDDTFVEMELEEYLLEEHFEPIETLLSSKKSKKVKKVKNMRPSNKFKNIKENL